jgi:hypothetical protein
MTDSTLIVHHYWNIAVDSDVASTELVSLFHYIACNEANHFCTRYA